MITIEKVSIYGLEEAIRGMRNAKNSWDRIDSHYCGAQTYPIDSCDNCAYLGEQCLQSKQVPYIVGPNDLKLMNSLSNGGPVHAKYRRFITAYLDITAPLYWWKEFDTYRVGVTPNPTDIEMNSCSTMHKIHERPLTLGDFSIDHLLPASLEVIEATIRAINECRDLYSGYDGFKYKYGEAEKKEYWYNMIQLLPSSYNQKRTIMLNYEVLANIYEWRKNHKLDEWVEFCHWIESLPYSEIITGNPGTSIFYLCDRKKCENCNNIDCHHTSDINHAVNFEKSGHVYSEKVKTPDICPYWNYEDHSSIYMCNGCEEENNGVMVNGDRYCNIISPAKEEE